MSLDNLTTKTCAECAVEKPTDEFSFVTIASGRLRARCKKCRSISMQIARRNDPMTAEKRRQYRAGNKELVRAQKARYQERHRDEIAEYRAEYRQRQHGTVKAAKAARRRSARQATPSWANRQAMAAIYQKARALRAAGFDVHVDHIIPLRGANVCGLHVEYNLQIISAEENLTKGAGVPKEIPAVAAADLTWHVLNAGLAPRLDFISNHPTIPPNNALTQSTIQPSHCTPTARSSAR